MLKFDMQPFLTAETIAKLTDGLAFEINNDYGKQDIILICPLKGSSIFCADLSRRLKMKVKIDFVHLTSPKGQSVHMIKDVSLNLFQKYVLIIEEIIDAGRTLSFLHERILSSHPTSLKICTLLDKPARRELPISPNYVGMTIEDRFVLGYGMDSNEIGRNYKDIYIYKQ